VNSIFKIIPLENPVLQEYKDKAIKELNEFFNQKWVYNTPKLFVVDDRKSYNLLVGRETEAWEVGNSLDGNVGVCILSPENISKESSHTDSSYDVEKLIKHELGHCWFRMTFGRQSKFSWVNEGVSVYVAGQLDRYSMPKEFRGFLEGVNLYQESGSAVKLLIDIFGKPTLFEFLKKQSGIEKAEELNVVFEDIFKAKLDYSFFNGLKDKSSN
jgi:hypothetical protein